jgi:hypothetical protein
MDNFSLNEIDIKGLRTFSNERDVLRDLFVYLDYVSERSIKRTTRGNEIPRADQQRLTKLLGGLSTEKELDWDYSEAESWIYFIDHLAFRLHLVSFDIHGEYRGESSSEPSFPDNYMSVNAAQFRAFLELSPVKQERRILETLRKPEKIDVYGWDVGSEFYQTGILGELDSFSSYGSGVGINPFIQYPEARQFLLELLAKILPGTWFSTSSLIQYVKYNHPFFLIPEKLSKDRWGKTPGRHDNFYEAKDPSQYQTTVTIPENVPDAFERVEGRYIERFLENIPLIMRFVEVAYDPEPYHGVYPLMGTLKAVRVNERLRRILNGEEMPARVTVQPNFDVVVESGYYPAKIIRQVAALGERVSSPTTSGAYVEIFQLKKARVAAEQVRQPDLDIVALLKNLSGRDLPSNVQIELEEWSGHADQFTLFEGFALLESTETLPQAEKFLVERLSPHLSIVRNAPGLFISLENEGCVPLEIPHLPDEFFPLQETMTSIFPKETAIEDQVKAAAPLAVSCTVSITARFPDVASFDAFRKMLAELRCPFLSDSKILSITFEQKNQAKFDEAIQKLSDVYAVTIL